MERVIRHNQMDNSLYNKGKKAGGKILTLLNTPSTQAAKKDLGDVVRKVEKKFNEGVDSAKKNIGNQTDDIYLGNFCHWQW